MKYLFVLILMVSLPGVALDREIPVEGMENVSCRVRTSFGSSGFSGRCSFDDVMTGIQSLDPLRVTCSRLEVTCNRTDTQPDDPGTVEPINNDVNSHTFR